MKKNIIISIIIINCLLMALIDVVIIPDYFVKSFFKIILFSVTPFLYFKISKDTSYKSIIKFDKKNLKLPFILGLSVFSFILLSYLILHNFFDFSNLRNTLNESYNYSFIYFFIVTTYIALINSFLEEFFFRGFSFLVLKNYVGLKFSFIFSSFAFSIYHTSFMFNWFSLPLFIILLLSLFIGGLIFNFLNYKYNNFFPSYIVHIFANLSLNIIGFIVFLT